MELKDNSYQGVNPVSHITANGLPCVCVIPTALFFSVQITGDLPELAKPDPSAALAPLPILSPAAAATEAANMAAQSAKPPHPANSIRVWLNCP